MPFDVVEREGRLTLLKKLVGVGGGGNNLLGQIISGSFVAARFEESVKLGTTTEGLSVFLGAIFFGGSPGTDFSGVDVGMTSEDVKEARV